MYIFVCPIAAQPYMVSSWLEGSEAEHRGNIIQRPPHWLFHLPQVQRRRVVCCGFGEWFKGFYTRIPAHIAMCCLTRNEREGNDRIQKAVCIADRYPCISLCIVECHDIDAFTFIDNRTGSCSHYPPPLIDNNSCSRPKKPKKPVQLTFIYMQIITCIVILLSPDL